MQELISYQSKLLETVERKWHRYAFSYLSSEERMVGIKGLRGVGKTTMLLQYLATEYPARDKGLYVTMDHPYFYNASLFELASEWYTHGGKLLLIDEVHKTENWSRQLKLSFDGHPDLRIIFTSSSALDLYRGESDLSRRLVTVNLHGMSFREYLTLVHKQDFPVLTLEDILKEHQSISSDITNKFKPIPLFKQYLVEGYFPFIKDVPAENYSSRLLRVINAVLESDLTYAENYSASNIIKLRKLLGVIASSAPFEPNISKIAERLRIGRNTIVEYLKQLSDARVLQLLNKPNKGVSALQKPDKIYFENPNFVHAFQNRPEIGTVRETFLANQFINAGHRVELSPVADFLLDGKWTIETGGKNKTRSQIRDVTDSFLALDDIEQGFKDKIPLYLFGFLY